MVPQSPDLGEGGNKSKFMFGYIFTYMFDAQKFYTEKSHIQNTNVLLVLFKL